jgi:hypothetical protein
MQCIVTVNLKNDTSLALVEKFLETGEDILSSINIEYLKFKNKG